MGTITISKTYFSRPEKINENQYLTLKNELSKNPNLDISPKTESFSEYYKGQLTTFKVCGSAIILGLILSAIGGGNSNLEAVGVTLCAIGIIIGAMLGITFIQEAPSYATFIKDKDEYYSKMKIAIKNTNTYLEFCSSFYNKYD